MALLKVTEQERRRLWEIARAADAGWRERERVDMVLLADEGWSAPRIARHLGRCAATVRRVLRSFVQDGPEALFARLAGRKPDRAHRQRVEASLHALLSQPRSWTAGQLASALEGEGLHLGPRQVRRYLGSMGAGWRRTRLTLTHKQDAQAVAQARQALFRLKKSPRSEDKSLLPG
ncbi:helix-turn-helix domain-containing protein [Archangium primigenium]|uniref:helix-turn-helix domain-containing protein n=1 Tax=[Archangium] primigenium TaxID=2792470 RepID=UPI0023BAABCD|nr:helix-turn-helix domain-containing protein [Archangium primigenium]MBM7116924.1 helix-turn-helix domain-containing protein [Archangium primigenium]MBM7118153.1 helix-turn-helix domain-containing protein [Archangium primigenium]MBM7118263.1 helix-turn-helix domain-containing protein [Archangium primigenium]